MHCLASPLLCTRIFHDPLDGAILRGFPQDWKDLPPDKSLMGARAQCGLPIGNLTSQLYANLYLNPLDHFVKRDLGFAWYVRYVDDMLFLHPSRQFLVDAIPPVRQFLSEHLGLRLHPRKISLQPVARGFPFLGAYILPHRVYAGRRLVRNYLCSLKSTQGTPGTRAASRVQSYLGLLGHFNTARLVAATLG